MALDVGVVARRWLTHLGWYINLQRPMRRNLAGLEAMDLMLDVVVEPDLSSRWKDREESDQIVEREIFEPDLGDQVMAEALSVIDDLNIAARPSTAPGPRGGRIPPGTCPRFPMVGNT
jgi:hypothetical protein